MSIVANNIKYLRRMNGLTQEQFARKIGIKRSLLGAYEESRANPNLDNLMSIAQIFGTTVDNLIKNDIRRMREQQGIPLPQPATQLLEPNEPEAPKPLASLIDKYYQQPNNNPPAKQATFAKTPKPAPSFEPQPVNELFVKPAPPPAAASNKPSDDNAVWVSQQNVAEYMSSYAYEDYLQKLPELVLPTLPLGKHRAFEAGNDFPVAGATVIGEFVPNWFDIRDGKHYLVVLHKQGVLYRRVYNHVKIKGTVLLLSDLPNIPTVEVSVKEVLEFWEARQYISPAMPEPTASLPLEKLATLTAEMQREIDHLRR